MASRCSLVLSLLVAADALQSRPPVRRPLRPSRSGGVLLAAGVQLQSLRPTLPPVDPNAIPAQLFMLGSGFSLFAPTWLPERSALGFLAGDRQFVWMAEDGSVLEMPSTGSRGHAAVGANVLAACGADGLRAVDVDTGAACELSLKDAERFSQVTAMLPLADNKLLIAYAQGGESVVVSLGPEDAPTQLLTLAGSVSGMSVTDGERELLLSVGGAVVRASMQQEDVLTCDEPKTLAYSDGGAAAAPVAVDISGNVYVCTADGVQVLDDEGEPVLLITLPTPPTGICFGGEGGSALLVTAADGVWSVPGNVQGVAPPTEAFQKKMDKFVAAGDFRHVGW